MVQEMAVAEPVKVKPCNVTLFTADVDEDPVKLAVIAVAVALI